MALHYTQVVVLQSDVGSYAIVARFWPVLMDLLDEVHWKHGARWIKEFAAGKDSQSLDVSADEAASFAETAEWILDNLNRLIDSDKSVGVSGKGPYRTLRQQANAQILREMAAFARVSGGFQVTGPMSVPVSPELTGYGV